MICYKDRTFCISENCTCEEGRKYTEQIQEDANGWWKRSGCKGDGPVAIADICQGKTWEEEDGSQ